MGFSLADTKVNLAGRNSILSLRSKPEVCRAMTVVERLRGAAEALGSRSAGDAALFLAVLDAGSLSAAARRLGCTPAALSKRLAALEARLGVKLVSRSTRRFVPTEAGRLFYERCRAALAQLALAEQEVSADAVALSGLLRVSAPLSFGRRRIAPLIGLFQDAYPQIEVRLRLDDAAVDVVDEGIDVALTIGQPRDNAVVVRRLLRSPRLAVASPGYLERRGVPQVPEDLAQHCCILLQRGAELLDRWMFDIDGQMQSVRVSGPLATNSGEVAHAWALAGHGIALKAEWDIAEDLAAGRLVEVLPQTRIDALEIFAVYADKRFLAARTRAFVNFVSANLRA